MLRCFKLSSRWIRREFEFEMCHLYTVSTLRVKLRGWHFFCFCLLVLFLLFISFSSCNIFNFHFPLLYLPVSFFKSAFLILLFLCPFLCLSMFFYLSIFFFLLSFFLCMWLVTGFCEHGNEILCAIKDGNTMTVSLIITFCSV